MQLTKSNKDWIEHNLRKLDFVQWDRCTFFTNAVGVFGWIKRDDKHEDFVWLMFLLKYHVIDPITSSKKYSRKIHAVVCGEEAEHADCARVEDNFEIKNCVKVVE